jgi:uncharacterized YigZ family protein
MRYLKEKVIEKVEINKSIFIALLYPIHSLDDLNLYINEVKLLYPKANHYTYGLIFGKNQEHMFSSDDGEPSRTAGIPILEVLKHHDVTNILAIVIRYFGGIKLGASGLVRAYTNSVAAAIKNASFYYKKIVFSYEISFSYEKISYIDHYLEKKVTIIEKDFQEIVTYIIALNDEDSSLIDNIKHLLTDFQQLENLELDIDIKP